MDTINQILNWFQASNQSIDSIHGQQSNQSIDHKRVRLTFLGPLLCIPSNGAARHSMVFFRGVEISHQAFFDALSRNFVYDEWEIASGRDDVHDGTSRWTVVATALPPPNGDYESAHCVRCSAGAVWPSLWASSEGEIPVEPFWELSFSVPIQNSTKTKQYFACNSRFNPCSSSYRKNLITENCKKYIRVTVNTKQRKEIRLKTVKTQLNFAIFYVAQPHPYCRRFVRCIYVA